MLAQVGVVVSVCVCGDHVFFELRQTTPTQRWASRGSGRSPLPPLLKISTSRGVFGYFEGTPLRTVDPISTTTTPPPSVFSSFLSLSSDFLTAALLWRADCV
eukprot:TRINITY_DN6774_c0_g1_i1.p1 TRINITY_DN6774_c0_g1~~TRINITY_DN6774_c0_g1_i1.p1  ORF type:complete len:102 (+),score=5.99 TRINITY_DN6774_c0_g1_i1:720-1025(+)